MTSRGDVPAPRGSSVPSAALSAAPSALGPTEVMEPHLSVVPREVARPTYDEFAAAAVTRLVRTAYLLTGDPHDANDLAQDVLERLFVAWDRVHGDPYGYAHRILVNLAHNRRRWRRRHPEAELTVVVDRTERDASDAVVAHEVIVQALQQLTPGQRAVVVLRYFQDLSEAETAAALGVSVGTVKSQGSKAMAALRRVVPPPDDESSPTRELTGSTSAGSPKRGTA